MNADLFSAATFLLLVAFCAPIAVWPYRAARLGERWQAVGSTDSWSEVEPSPVVVRVARILAVLAVLFGLLGAVGTLLG